jgi:hypothetical protein
MKITPVFIFFLWFFYACTELQAQSNKWWNVAAGDWNIASNWNPSSIPTGTDDVIIQTGTAFIYLGTTANSNDSFIGTVTTTPGNVTVYGNWNTRGLDLSNLGSLDIINSGSVNSSVVVGRTCRRLQRYR